jgi:hypothetical protein
MVEYCPCEVALVKNGAAQVRLREISFLKGAVNKMGLFQTLLEKGGQVEVASVKIDRKQEIGAGCNRRRYIP